MSEARALTHLVGALGREWLTCAELAVYAKFPSSEAARKFVTRHRADLVLGRRGRLLLIDKHAFDRYLETHSVRELARLRSRTA